MEVAMVRFLRFALQRVRNGGMGISLETLRCWDFRNFQLASSFIRFILQ